MKNTGRYTVAFFLLSFAISAYAESVNVKYRGMVNLASFECEQITRSSFINRLCYDSKERYVIVLLKNTYYHYCEVPKSVVGSWKVASSMGRYYGSYIKGNYDCRVNYLPSYE